MTLAEQQIQTGRLYIQRAEKHFQKGDMTRASKSAWDAVEFCLKSVAEHRGWSHESHLDLSRAVSRLAKERDNARQMRVMFLRMTGLYVNSYEDWFEDVFVRDGIEEAKELMAMLEKA